VLPPAFSIGYLVRLVARYNAAKSVTGCGGVMKSNVIGLAILFLTVPALESFLSGFFHFKTSKWDRELTTFVPATTPVWERTKVFLRALIPRIALLAICLLLAFLALKIAPPVATSIDRRVGSNNYRILIVGLVCVLGIAAHYIKRLSQYFYGFVGLILAISSGFAVALSISGAMPSLAQFSSLVGCAYATASGMNDMRDARLRALQSPVLSRWF
jgi:hypothetical protein